MRAEKSPGVEDQNATGANQRTRTLFEGTSLTSESNEDASEALAIAYADREGKNSKLWRRDSVTWAGVLAWMKSPADYKEGRGYVLGTLAGEDPNKLERTKETVLSRSAITLDVDTPQADFLDRLKGHLGVQNVVIHTTYTSTSEKPRYRIIIPLEAPLLSADYRAAVGELMRRVSPDGGEFDAGSSQPERFMYPPSVQDGETFWFDVWEGSRLDASKLAEVGRERAKAYEAAPGAANLVGPDDGKAYFRGAVRDQADWLAFHTEGSRNDALNMSAFKLGQIAHLWPENSDDDAEDIAYSALLWACEANGLLDDDGEAECLRTFNNGWPPGLKEPRDVKPAPRIGSGAWGQADQETQGQRRMAHRLARIYRGRLLHVHGIGWHHWTGTHWAEDKDGAVSRAVDDVLRRAWVESFNDKALRRDVSACQSGASMNGITDIARSLEGMSATADQMDADPWLLNVANGALDLHTLELRPHRFEDRCTKVTRGAWNPGEAGPGWERFLSSSLPDLDVRSFLQRYVGQALIGRFMEKKMVLLKGQGDNGKSVWAESIANALGDYAMSAQPDMLLTKKHQSAFDGTVELRGRRWAVISEVEQGRELAPATVKRLTGGDRIRARNLREKNIEFDPSHTLVMLVNHLPHVTDRTEAMWERLRVVHWDVVIPRERRDPLLTEKLQAEADAVLGWAIAGLRDYQNRGGLDEPEQVRLATGAYREDNDDVSQFFDECVESDPGGFVTPTTLHDAYKHWCYDNRLTVLGRKCFGEEIRRLKGLEVGGRDRAWQGISLSRPGEEDDDVL